MKSYYKKEKRKRLTTDKYLKVKEYRNVTEKELILSFPSNEDKTNILPGETWCGDDRYISYLQSDSAVIVGSIEDHNYLNTRKKLMENLILDQPDVVSLTKAETHAKSEHDNSAEMLLTEEPVGGIEVISENEEIDSEEKPRKTRKRAAK